MKRSWILSTVLTTALLSGSVLPAFADDHDKGKGRDRGNQKSESRRNDNHDKGRGDNKWKNDDKSRNNDNRWDNKRQDNDRWERERREREARERRERDERERRAREAQFNRDRDERNRRERDRRSDDWNRNNSYGRNQSELDRLSDQRQKTKNEWRNIAILSGAVGVLGLLKHDNTLMFAGAAGALYSLDRYEKDRKSQSQVDRLRADYFSRSSFTRDGRQYNRRTMVKGGKKYYQFVCN